MAPLSLQQSILNRWGQLKSEREPYMEQWEELSTFITPASGNFLDLKNENRSRWRFNKIYNNTALRASNILSAGLMSGMTNPSSQWFSLTTGSPDLDANHDNRVWLEQVQRIMELQFTQTNVYQALQHMWREVSTFGVTATVITEDPVWGFVCHPLCIGEYCIACDYRGRPDTLYRRFRMTAGQLMTRYGRAKVSESVRNAYDTGRVDESFRVLHAIEPRRERDPSKLDRKNMPWRSVTLLIEGHGEAQPTLLDEGGYRDFPAVVGRWGASATDVYSQESPGIVALGDTKNLMHSEMQKGRALDYQVNPPIIMPASARDNEVDLLPGGISYLATAAAKDQVQTAWNVALPLGDLAADMQTVTQRINQAFYVDLFLMFQGDTQNMTATEVAQRSSEKLMMLGPVLSRLNNEILKSLIERTYNILYRKSAFPPPPDGLQGQALSIEYTSMLAQSQRAMRANTVDQFLQRLLQLAQIKPEVTTKIDAMQVVDEYADALSVSPKIIVPTEQAQAQLQQMQQAQAQQAQAAQMQQSAEALSKLGRVPADRSTMAGQAVGALADAVQQQGGGQ